MKIEKIGHCCLIIDIDGLKIMTDPGAFSNKQDSMTDIDVVLISHEHPDHLHINSVQKIVENNPGVRVITNSSVAKKLEEIGLKPETIESNTSISVRDIKIEAFDSKHGEIFEDFGQVQNTGYLVADRFFYPGDSFYNPVKPIDILALPVAGPWCLTGDAIRYALEVKPKTVFPVHDGMIEEDKRVILYRAPEKILRENGIEFVVMKEGEEREF